MTVWAADSGRCPANFIQINNNSCYYAVSKIFDWWQAADECYELHSDAFPVAINDEEEQEAVHAVSSRLGRSNRWKFVNLQQLCNQSCYTFFYYANKPTNGRVTI